MPVCVENKFLEKVIQAYSGDWQAAIAKELLSARKQLAKLNTEHISPSNRPRSRRREQARREGKGWPLTPNDTVVS